MAELLAAITAFLLTHLIPAAPPVRAFLIRALGRGLYIAFYSLISLGVIVWLVAAYADAPYVEVWGQTPALRWGPVLVMPVACVLLVAGLTSANPLSITPTRRPYDPARPGVVSLIRHPVLWGLGLWAVAHIAPNGDVASLSIFGLLLVLSVVGMISHDAKARTRWGREEWMKMKTHDHVDWRGIGGWRVVGGLALYLVLIVVHPVVIGVSPLP